MTTSITIGLVLSSIFLIIIIKLILGLKSDSKYLKVEFPTGWERKIKERYALFSKLSMKEKNHFLKKVQLLIAKKKIVGLESQEINIDIRLAVASEISLVTKSTRELIPFKKLTPIAILPFDKYDEFKERSSYTLYWDKSELRLMLETPSNELLIGSYYLWLKVDKRFKDLNDTELISISKKLSQCETNAEFDFSLF